MTRFRDCLVDQERSHVHHDFAAGIEYAHGPQTNWAEASHALVAKNFLPNLSLTHETSGPGKEVPENWLQPFTLNRWELKAPANDHAFKIVPAPGLPGKRAIKIEVRHGDQWEKDLTPARVDDQKERAEFSDNTFQPMGSTRSYSFDLYLPKEFPQENKRLVLAQWWQQDEKSPPLALRYEKGHLYIDLRLDGKDKEKLFEIKDFKPGDWADLRIKIHWSDKNDGTVQVWFNGKPLRDEAGDFTFTGRNCNVDSKAPLFKFGIYRHSSPSTYVAYYRDVQVDSNNEPRLPH